MNLTSLLAEHGCTTQDLVEAQNLGYVRLREHPDDPSLVIYNYTDQAQYDGAWGPVVRLCRGLIVNDASGEVLARPFEKFFNLGQPEAPTPTAGQWVTAWDKLDGSLGILYRAPDGDWAIATRGSFTSEQAIAGTQMLRNILETTDWEPMPGYTHLFEIIFPENRIVVDYGPRHELVLLAEIEIETGILSEPFDPFWEGSYAEPLYRGPVEGALALPPRPNAEGMVLWLWNDDGIDLVKIKQDDYVELHRIVTGMNEKTVWAALAAGKPVETLIEGLPDEFHGWVREVDGRLEEEHDLISALIHDVFVRVQDVLDETHGLGSWERRDFARLATEHPKDHAAYLFALLDGRDISPMIWKNLEPKGVTPGPRLNHKEA